MTAPATPQKVYLDYDRATLDRNYEPRAWARDAEKVGSRYRRRSEEVRRQLPGRWDLAYGQGPDEKLDLFPGAGSSEQPHPLVLFVHGGGWRRGSRTEACFAAEVFVERGISFAAVDFSLLPHAPIRQMVDQLARAIAWVYRNAADLGIDPGRIVLVGHSSGAHMVSAALGTDWRGFAGLGAQPIKAALCISGLYDLEGVCRSSRGPEMNLTADDIEALSPARHPERLTCPMTLVYGQRDPDEFKRQSEAFARALSAAGKLKELLPPPDLDHYEIVEALADPASPIFAAALSLVGAPPPRS